MKLLLGLMLIMNIFNMVGIIILKQECDSLNGELNYHENKFTSLTNSLLKEADNRTRGLLSGENKMNDLDERLKILQCRLNQERMKDIMNGKNID